jgi:hypothetical protein
MYEQLQAWVAASKHYLATKEVIDNEDEATLQRNLLEAHRQEKSDKHAGSVKSLVAKGDTIRAAEYKTALSQWKYETPEAMSALEGQIATDWEEMAAGAVTKQEVLDDALARTQLKASVLLLVNRHEGLKTRLTLYAEAKKQYLQAKEDNDSLSAVAICLRLLQAFDEEQAQVMQTSVASLRGLGQEVATTEYSSKLSTWKYPDQSAIGAKERDIDAGFTQVW